MTNPPRITDDGERVALGLEPIDDTPTPAKRARGRKRDRGENGTGPLLAIWASRKVA